jgi:chromosome segregation ATPase
MPYPNISQTVTIARGALLGGANCDRGAPMVADVEKDLKSVEKELDDATKRIDSIEDWLATLDNQATGFLRQIRDLDDVTIEARKRIDRIEDRLNKLYAVVDKLGTGRDEELDDATKRIDRVENRLGKLDNETDALVKEVREEQKVVEKMLRAEVKETRLKVIEANIADLRGQVDQIFKVIAKRK